MEPICSTEYIFEAKCKNIAKEVLDVFDAFGFSTENPIDTDKLQEAIVVVLKKNIIGNTNIKIS